MVWFDNRSSVSSNTSRSHRRRSPSRRSNSNSHLKHSAPSVHSMPSHYNNYNYGSDSNVNGPSAGVGGRKSPSTSVYSGASSSTRRRAKPRKGFVKRVVRSIRQILRDIYDYARTHPIKTFFMVIVPLVVTGVLQKLLGMIGIRLPKRIFGRLAVPPSFDGLKAHVIALIRVAKWAVKY